jgi:hypothetical protein
MYDYGMSYHTQLAQNNMHLHNQPEFLFMPPVPSVAGSRSHSRSRSINGGGSFTIATDETATPAAIEDSGADTSGPTGGVPHVSLPRPASPVASSRFDTDDAEKENKDMSEEDFAALMMQSQTEDQSGWGSFGSW